MALLWFPVQAEDTYHPVELAAIVEAARPPTPPVVAAAPRVYRGIGSNTEQWRHLVEHYFPASQVHRAMCVLAAESGGNPNARNPRSDARGLFQHLTKYWRERSRAAGWGGYSAYHPEANIAVAAWLQRTGGWQHWSPVKRGQC